jgi:hypothetical protein
VLTRGGGGSLNSGNGATRVAGVTSAAVEVMSTMSRSVVGGVAITKTWVGVDLDRTGSGGLDRVGTVDLECIPQLLGWI